MSFHFVSAECKQEGQEFRMASVMGGSCEEMLLREGGSFKS